MYSDTKYWHDFSNENYACILHINMDSAPTVQLSVKIDKQLEMSAYVKDIPLENLSSYKFPFAVNHFSQIDGVLEQLKTILSYIRNRV